MRTFRTEGLLQIGLVQTDIYQDQSGNEEDLCFGDFDKNLLFPYNLQDYTYLMSNIFISSL